MSRLGAHPNVHASCVALLTRRGWIVWIEPGPYEASDARLDGWAARRDGTELLAASPIELLGLAALHEHHHPHDGRPYWWTVSPIEPGLVDRLQDEALERAFWELHARAPQVWAEEVQQAIERAEGGQVSVGEVLGVSEEAAARAMAAVRDR